PDRTKRPPRGGLLLYPIAIRAMQAEWPPLEQIRMRPGTDENHRIVVREPVNKQPVITCVALTAISASIATLGILAMELVIQQACIQWLFRDDILHGLLQARDIALLVRDSPLEVALEL